MSIEEQVKAKIDLIIENAKETINGLYKAYYEAINKELGRDKVEILTNLDKRIKETENKLEILKEVQKEIYCTLGIWNYDVQEGGKQ